MLPYRLTRGRLTRKVSGKRGSCEVKAPTIAGLYNAGEREFAGSLDGAAACAGGTGYLKRMASIVPIANTSKISLAVKNHG